MPTLDDHHASKISKVLLIGNSGAGKTGLLGSLANAGYRVFGFDFDNGFDILRDPSVVRPENRKNVYYKTFTNKLKGVQRIPDGMPKAILDAMNSLDNWKEGDTSLGGAYTWGERDVIWWDSLTLSGQVALDYVLFLNGMIGKPPQLQHWGEAIRIQESILQMLYSEQVACNVVVTSHLTFINETGTDMQKAFPSALGNKLPPKIGRYFNSLLYVEKQPVPNAPAKRLIRTNATFNMDLKTPISTIPATIEPDLAKYFEMVRKG